MSLVSIAACQDYDIDAVEEAVHQALSHLGGISAFVKPGDRVLIKTNLLSSAAPERAVTTHPAVIRAVIRQVRNVGATPVVGDSPGGPNTPGMVRRLFRETGIGEACREEGVELILLDDETVRLPNPTGALYGSFTVGRAVADCDVLITAPKFKTHSFMMFTGAVKNLFGCIPGLEKAQYHLKVPERDDFASMLVDLMLACRPALAIMDAVVGMEGEGPAGGSPRQIGAIMASGDCVALDVIASAMAGLDPMEVYTNRMAARRGIAPSSVDEVTVVGADWRGLAPPGFDLPAADVSRRLPPALTKRIKGWTTAKPVLARALACTRCDLCAQVCPVDAIVVAADGPQFDRDACIRCYCCQELCPAQAIGLSVPPLARFASRRR